MFEENHAADQDIIEQGDECDSIFFIVDGLIDVRFEDVRGESHMVEVLGQGDNFAQYSALTQSKFLFTMKARS